MSKAQGRKQKAKVQQFAHSLFIMFSVLCFLLYVAPFGAFAQDSTDSGKNVRDTLRERVEQRLEELTNKPRAFVGTITDIQNSSLLIETNHGTRQLKINDDTAIVDTKNKSNKTIATKDLAIGNIIVAMGYLDPNEVLDTRRILVQEEKPQSSRHSVYGLVESVNKGTLNIKHPTKVDIWTLKTTNKTLVTAKGQTDEKLTVEAIEEGDRIVAVGTPVENAVNTLSARLIHIIPGRATGLLAKPSPSASPSAKVSPSPRSSPRPTATP